MEKLLLGTFFSDNKLDIVYEENINISVFFTKLRGGYIIFVPDGLDQLVGELFTGHIENLGRIFRILRIPKDKMTDGMHQVGFSQTDPAVDKQRIVDGSRGFRHRQGRSVGKIVVFSYHEGIEGVLRIEIGIL